MNVPSPVAVPKRHAGRGRPRLASTGRYWLVLCVVCMQLLPALSTASTHGNRLANHPSPYLAMHGNDPVNWRLWGPEALRQARESDRVIFLSIGYFSCYWCHVMHRESYLDQNIARLLNRYFVPIKVDRELNPALDQTLLNYVEATRGYSGWPLNVFLTPEGGPLFGLVYAPPDRFQALLSEVSTRWQQDPEALRALGARARAQLVGRAQPTTLLSLPLKAGPVVEVFRRQTLAVADEISGGFGDQAKFPSVPQLSTLLTIYETDRDPELRQFLELSLHAMASQGLRDQVGGGFFRYVVDPTWEMPHFEKMLYDNALLAGLYLRAARVLGADWARAVAFDTLNFMLRDLGADGGGLMSSLSAVDEEGVEGGVYLWDTVTLQRVLDAKEQEVVAVAWGLGEGPTEHGYLARQQAGGEELARSAGVGVEEAGSLLESARAKLLAERGRRHLPVDTKVLAGWNGLALSALAVAVGEDGGESYRQQAQALRDYLLGVLWDQGELLRLRNGADRVPAALEDYAYVARGLLHWAELEGNDDDMVWVAEIVTQAWQRFSTDRGWKLTEEMLVPLATVEAVLPDGATPSPSAVLLDVSLRLSAHMGDPKLYSRVLAAGRRGARELSESPYFHATQVALLMALSQE